MSRAFTSEEYESREVIVEKPVEIKPDADHELVYAYCRNRDINDPSLPYEIGLHFVKGDDGFFQSDGFAIKWLDKAVKNGIPEAMVSLAELYLSNTKEYGYRKAAVLLRKAADLGNADAQGYIDMGKVGVPSTKKAFVTFRLNAELGNVEAMLSLAQGFEKEWYGKDRCKAAAVWYTRAFRKGDRDAAKRVLNLYYKKKIELTEEELKELRS